MTLGKGLYFRKGINKNIEIFSDADLGWFYDRQKSHLWLLHLCRGESRFMAKLKAICGYKKQC